MIILPKKVKQLDIRSVVLIAQNNIHNKLILREIILFKNIVFRGDLTWNS